MVNISFALELKYELSTQQIWTLHGMLMKKILIKEKKEKMFALNANTGGPTTMNWFAKTT